MPTPPSPPMMHVIRVVWIDPDRVDVVVHDERRVDLPRLAAVDSEPHPDTTHIDAIGIVRVDADLTEVVRAEDCCC
jgi:hypothetical protein